jgi:hypothetical protein
MDMMAHIVEGGWCMVEYKNSAVIVDTVSGVNTMAGVA